MEYPIPKWKYYLAIIPFYIMKYFLIGALIYVSYGTISNEPQLALLGFIASFIGWIGLK